MPKIDTTQLLNMTMQSPTSTEYTPIPEGVYAADTGQPSLDQFEIKKGDNAGNWFTKLSVPCIIDDEYVREVTGRQKPVVDLQIPLDLTETGGISDAKGDNVKLGRFREAIGYNDKPFNPANNTAGHRVLIKVAHRETEDGPMAYVQRVAAFDPKALQAGDIRMAGKEEEAA